MKKKRADDQTVEAFSLPIKMQAEMLADAAAKGLTKSGYVRAALARMLGWPEEKVREVSGHLAQRKAVEAMLSKSSPQSTARYLVRDRALEMNDQLNSTPPSSRDAAAEAAAKNFVATLTSRKPPIDAPSGGTSAPPKTGRTRPGGRRTAPNQAPKQSVSSDS